MFRFESPSRFDERESALLARAEAWRTLRDLRELDTAALCDVSRHEGIDFATALLYDRVCRSTEHGAFIKSIDESDGDAAEANLFRDVDVLVVPGAFHAQQRQTGADGRLVVDAARRLGCNTTLIDVPSFGSPAENAIKILRTLQSRRSGRRFVMVSLSKGSLDVRRALEHRDGDAAFANVDCWISISGLAMGSPLVSWLRRRPWRLLGLRMLFAWHGLPYSVLGEIDRDAVLRGESVKRFSDASQSLASRVIHIVGFPLKSHLSCPLAKRGHRRLEPLGPNDSAVLLADVCRLPGVVYPVWGADHYLKLPDANVGKIFARVLSRVLASAPAPSLAGRIA
jgi:hypothetical protein